MIQARATKAVSDGTIFRGLAFHCKTTILTFFYLARSTRGLKLKQNSYTDYNIA